jgi:hypothetical protein
LEKGAESKFNLNVDGLPGDSHTNIEIAPKDSIYVFAEVTINPKDPLDASPFVIDENVVFETNGNVQKVVLEAWGQNAVYLPSRFGKGTFSGYGCNNGEWVWNAPRPYVIYGVVIVDECTVRMPPGTRVYIHGGLGKLKNSNGSTTRYNDGILSFVNSGRLSIEGTKEKPVIIESDRLEPEFNEEPGQFVGIWLQKATRGHQVEHAIIRNSILGIRVDSAADLTLKNTQIYNTAGAGLIGLRAKIYAENCLFYSNSNFGIQLEWGGEYEFNYCTSASYGVNGEALGMSNTLCLDAQCVEYSVYPLKARFQNCIFYGSKEDQITLFDRERKPENFDYQFTNCIVRVKKLTDPKGFPDFFDHCEPCKNALPKDTIFINPNKNLYRLDTLRSIANKYGVPIPNITKDLDGKTRDANKPDVGCYEIEF